MIYYIEIKKKRNDLLNLSYFLYKTNTNILLFETIKYYLS